MKEKHIKDSATTNRTPIIFNFIEYLSDIARYLMINRAN